MMEMNPSQQQVVNHDGNLVVAAPPGSGKTRVLVERTRRLLEHQSGRIFLVTFTRNAAREMKVRIGEQGGGRVHAATFDSYCLRMARKAGIPVGPPSPLQSWIAKKAALRDPAMKLNLDQVEEHITVASSLRDPQQAPALSARVYERYKDKLREQGVRDFSSIARWVVDQLEQGDRIPPLPASYLLVDEFQDADETQLAWVLAHSRAGAKVMVVGDDDQAIYGWRGGMGYRAMKTIETELGADVIMLDTCYRCRPEIIESARLLISHNSERFHKATRTPRPVNGKVQWWHIQGEKAAAFMIVQKLQHMGWPKFAVLARRNKDLDFIEGALTTTGKEVRRLGGKSFWSSIGAIAMLDLMEFVGKPEKREKLRTVLEWMQVQEHDAEVILESLDEGTVGGVAGQITSRPGVELTKVLIRAAKGHGSDSVEKAAQGIKELIYDYEDERWAGHKAAKVAIEFIGKKIRASNGRVDKTISDIRSAAASTRKESDEDVDGVLATMHAAKGLEWPVVFIVGANDGVMPNHSGSLEDDVEPGLLEEERRLFFVAITRAKDEVYIVPYRDAGEPSRFINEASADQPDLAEELEKWGVEVTSQRCRDLGIVEDEHDGARRSSDEKLRKRGGGASAVLARIRSK